MTYLKNFPSNFDVKQRYTFFILFQLFFVHGFYAQTRGCTDPLSLNFNKEAKVNDGSCVYPVTTVSVTETHPLSETIKETSGLILWNEKLWTQNDSGDTNLYVLNATNGAIEDSYALPNVKNTDWEELAQDKDYVYIGDFGNNGSGNRTDLHILRVEKKSLLARPPGEQESKAKIDTIAFTYSDQTDLSAQPANETDFDCEAFFVTENKIYLITKQWTGDKSVFYELPKTPGQHSATRVGTLDVQGLTTGCVYLAEKNMLALSGYDHELSPFVFLLYDFKGNSFLDGNKRRIMIDLPEHQVEAITTIDGLNFYITNELFNSLGRNSSPQALHKLDLAPYLEAYLSQKGLNGQGNENPKNISAYPNPSYGFFELDNLQTLTRLGFQVFDTYGKMITSGNLNSQDNGIDLSLYAPGTYFLKLQSEVQKVLKLIKR